MACVIPRTPSPHARDHGDIFPGWPTDLDGKALKELPLTEREQRFNSGFPGRIGRFTDGRREIIIRWITVPSHRLHAASVCLRASGAKIIP